jgi:2-amino-4-hydroxy-6-hydroxymethyldihydropteridine diphosphokinase
VNKKIQENSAEYISAIQIIKDLERKTSHLVPGTKREKNSNHKVFIGIGTNLGDRSKNIEEALNNLKLKEVTIVHQSPIYETEPYGLTDQPKFLNCAIETNTTLSPQELLETLLKIEKKMGRERKIPWGPRIIDLDILFYGDLVVNEESLIIPHPDLQNRFFVLKPLSDIAPEFLHPVSKKTIKQMLKDLENLPEKPRVKSKNE